ncbi:MAG: hypothetical protein Kow0081_3400 [Candidatus Dojkabacteria bacterium]
MISLVNYIILYIFTGVLFFVFNSSGFIDSLVTLFFILSTIFFIFSREDKPKKESSLKIPEVHYYHRSRINLYGYLMAGGGASVAFLFYITTMNNIRQGPIAILLWAFLILLSYYSSIYESKKMYADSVVDYILMNQKKGIPVKRIYLLVKNMMNSGTLDEKLLRKIIHDLEEKFADYQLSDEQEEELVKIYIKYVSATNYGLSEVVSDEVSALNEK